MSRSYPEVGTDSVAFASILSGAYASAAVALLFLVIDALRGDPFLTPSLMGSVVFLGSTPSVALPVRLDMVAFYSLLHVLVFSLIGTAFTLAGVRVAGFLDRHALFTAAVFGTLLLGAVSLDVLLFPGLVAAIGILPLVGANLGAAAVMAAVIRSSLRSARLGDAASRAIAGIAPAT